MNLLEIRDEHGRLIRERPVLKGETIWFSLDDRYSYTITPPAGYQLNGHVVGCRCGTCRPDLYATSAWVPSHDPWRLP